jgi:hypothetical protein
VFAKMQHVIANLDSLELTVLSVHAQISVQDKENVLIGHALVILVLWEMIVHYWDVIMDVEIINIVTMEHARATLDLLEPIVI